MADYSQFLDSFRLIVQKFLTKNPPVFRSVSKPTHHPTDAAGSVKLANIFKTLLTRSCSYKHDRPRKRASIHRYSKSPTDKQRDSKPRGPKAFPELNDIPDFLCFTPMSLALPFPELLISSQQSLDFFNGAVCAFPST